MNFKNCSESERKKVLEANKSLTLTPKQQRNHRVTIDTLPFGSFYEKFDIDPNALNLASPQVFPFF